MRFIPGNFVLQIICCTTVAVVLQMSAGAYRAELAENSDEPAHVVTGIALDQYVRDHRNWRSPVHFFENYYIHYPKVGIGHWPPLLYILQTAATLIFSPSRATVLAVQAVLVGILGAVVFRLLLASVGTFGAAAGVLSLLMVRVIQTHTSMVMAEILLTLTTLLACLAFARFTDSESWVDATWFGLAASAGILTKGTGWLIVLVVPVTLLLTRRWGLLMKLSFWYSATLIGVLCLPWQLFTNHLAAVGWASDSPNWEYFLRATWRLGKLLFTVPGPALTLLALVGVYLTIVKQWRHVSLLAAVLTALVISDWLFHAIVPAGIEARKLIVAVPPLFILAGLASEGIARRLTYRSKGFPVATIIFVCVCLTAILGSVPIEHKLQLGYVPTARALVDLMPPDTAALVSSDPDGEGALISEFALLSPDPSRYIVRISKFLSSSDWSGKNYKMLISNRQDCAQLLSSVPISFIVLDLRKSVLYPDHLFLKAFLNSPDSGWTQIRWFSPDGDQNSAVALYQSIQGPKPVQSLIINMQPMIGRELRSTLIGFWPTN